MYRYWLIVLAIFFDTVKSASQSVSFIQKDRTDTYAL